MRGKGFYWQNDHKYFEKRWDWNLRETETIL